MIKIIVHIDSIKNKRPELNMYQYNNIKIYKNFMMPDFSSPLLVDTLRMYHRFPVQTAIRTILAMLPYIKRGVGSMLRSIVM